MNEGDEDVKKTAEAKPRELVARALSGRRRGSSMVAVYRGGRQDRKRGRGIGGGHRWLTFPRCAGGRRSL
jgi:hypothetical protein